MCILRTVLLSANFLVLTPVLAAESAENPPEIAVSEEVTSEDVADEQEGLEDAEKRSRLDAHKTYVDTGVQRASQ